VARGGGRPWAQPCRVGGRGEGFWGKAEGFLGVFGDVRAPQQMSSRMPVCLAWHPDRRRAKPHSEGFASGTDTSPAAPRWVSGGHGRGVLGFRIRAVPDFRDSSAYANAMALGVAAPRRVMWDCQGIERDNLLPKLCQSVLGGSLMPQRVLHSIACPAMSAPYMTSRKGPCPDAA
jgi:hypothetical protein